VERARVAREIVLAETCSTPQYLPGTVVITMEL
jgi:hypothetical protein